MKLATRRLEYKRILSRTNACEAAMSKTVTLRIDEEVYETFVEAARAERRSLSNLIETAALAHLREQQFVDDAEMAEISSNEALVERLKQGHRDAAKRRGRTVG